MLRGWRALLHPPPGPVDRVDDPRERRAIVVELVIVGVLTFGFLGLDAVLRLIEHELTTGLSDATVALNPKQSSLQILDMIRQIMSVVRLVAIGALGAYLLWRSGIGTKRVGLGRPGWGDVPPAAILAAVIGLPGLALVALAQVMGWNANLVVAPTDDLWWRIPLLTVKSFANGFAEEVVVVGYFMTRLRQLGVGANGALASSALLRGSYHLYQGVGAGIGNVIMGLVYGRWYQATNRLWPLVIAHGLIDAVAFVGYAVLAETGWLGWV
ncbi:CPBP family intramembrane glutamic endopeptidase [Gordonia sp. (in: high G+C Gram-positive bacteria)]|uniref:CPBP family intramembrane glutamic endopeptidase n=1 Tax=Gordonia sp. (in: high G+C Gram-positive bacteria) TaxID=84139 RepID=UPI003C709A08